MKVIKVGSGLTETEAYQFSADPLSPEEQAKLDELNDQHTVPGRLSAIERACAKILSSVGLPESCGNYLCDSAGTWELAGNLRSGWTDTISPWTIARRQGHAPDSRVGFAARMVEDVHWLRDRLDTGNTDGALMMMFYLGHKWASSGIKERHGAKSHPIHVSSKSQRDVAMAQEFRSRRLKARKSDSALMAEIGREQTPPLKRTSAIDAIKRGLQVLSG